MGGVFAKAGITGDRASAVGSAIGKSGAKKIIGLVLGLVGIGLVVVAIGQWKDDKNDENAKSTQDKVVASVQWAAFALLLVFVAYKLYASN